MIDPNRILREMPVVCSEHGQFAVVAAVDGVEGDEMIKLSKDAKGWHHYIPLSWVTEVDDKVHVDRPRQEAMKEWSLTPPLCPACGHLA